MCRPYNAGIVAQKESETMYKWMQSTLASSVAQVVKNPSARQMDKEAVVYIHHGILLSH